MNISGVLHDIELLTTPSDGSKSSLEEVLSEIVEKFQNHHFNNLKLALNSSASNYDHVRWKYICLLADKLLEVKNLLESGDEKERMLSIQQKKNLSTCLEMFVSFGITANLPQGIGFPLNQRSSSKINLFENSSQDEKISSLKLTLSSLMELRKEEGLKTMINSRHLGDLLAALFSLLVPSVWTVSIAENERDIFKLHLQEIVEKTSQPSLIKELMLLNGNKDCPKRLSHVIRCIMTERLMLDGGVVATIRAILDMVGDVSPKQWKTVEVLSRLLINPHIKNREDYQNRVYPQILSLVYSKETQFMQVAVTCIRLLNETNHEICAKFFIDRILKALKKASDEEETTKCLNGIFNCIGIPDSSHWSLHPDLFSEVHVTIFRLYSQTLKSASFLKPILSDIVWSIISQCDLDQVFLQFVYEDSNFSFKYGESGGIEITNGKLETNWNEASDQFLNIIKTKNNNEIIIKLFHVLLNSILDGSIEKKLASASLLSEICSEPAVLKAINEDPSGIVNVIKSILDGEHGDEISCLALMVLGLILSNRPNDWNKLKDLTVPLKNFMLKCKNKEVRILADELYTTIMTHGAVKNEKNRKIKKCSFEEAMDEATDPLMPVRANGIRKLGQLLIHNDSETIAKKEMVLCVFKENLKEEDSYVYLAAIEGLSAIASTFPDEVITTLCEQFTSCKDSETRLKIGEVLVKVVRILNEMAVVYKSELINSYLDGCRDEDHLVRASSLSNLGEICKILSYRIHHFLTEILYCIDCIFDTDKFEEPRRAAVMVLTQLLKGLGSDALRVLEPILLTLYRKLKLIYQTEKDDIVKLHAQLALDEIDACTISFFRQPIQLEKRIFILDPPS